MWVKVTELPDSVQAALDSVSYGRVDIEVKVASTLVMSSAGCDGRRAFVTLVNLSTGERATELGSWGGENMFNPLNAVDRDNQPYPLPPNGVVVLGSTGYPRTFATLHIAPSLTDRMLAAPAPEVTEEERNALYCFASIKGGEYRRDEMRRRKVSPGTVDALVERGWLKRNRALATQITTEGRNALGDWRGY